MRVGMRKHAWRLTAGHAWVPKEVKPRSTATKARAFWTVACVLLVIEMISALVIYLWQPAWQPALQQVQTQCLPTSSSICCLPATTHQRKLAQQRAARFQARRQTTPPPAGVGQEVSTAPKASSMPAFPRQFAAWLPFLEACSLMVP